VCTVAWRVGCGRIYQTRGSPDNLRSFWSMTVNGPMTRSDRVATLEEASEIRSDRIAIFSKNLFGRMILSEKSATFRAHAQALFQKS
jgi:hypothetical protein